MRKSRSELDIHHTPSTHFTSWSGLTNTSNKSPSHSNREKKKKKKKLQKPIWKLSFSTDFIFSESFMGNYISLRASESTGKVILSDGTVHEFNCPLTVAELMLEHPQQVVVEFPPVMNGNKPTPLPADKKLDMKKAYLMLPMKRGKVVLSPDEARRIFYKAKSVLRSGSFLSSARILPLFARMCPVGIRVGNEVVFHRENDAIVNEPEKSSTLHDLLPEVFDQRPEFLSKQLSGKGWKPALDTITEKKIEKKVPHWLF